jgi:alkylresorcinol/alkylpyrone synthase
MTPVSLLSLATAVPPFVLDQREVAARAPIVFGRLFARYPSLREVFANTGIERRWSVRPIEWFLVPRGWHDRTEAYLDGAGDLFVQAAEAALARAGLRAADVDAVVTVSSTGIATPSLEARVGRRLGFRPDILRVPVFGLGCAGGVSGLAIATRLARGEPGSVVLMVAVEICTLAFRSDRTTKADVIATALFGDGAAAVVLRAGEDGAVAQVGAGAGSGRAADAAAADIPAVPAGTVQLGRAAQHTWPNTLDIMGWAVDPVGFGVVLSRSLPRFVEQRLATPARRFLRAAGLDRNETRFICHPGGAKVLGAVEGALGLQTGTLGDERAVLRDYGNMSAPSVLFVLERALQRRFSGPAVLSALGPGFTASFLALEAAHG